MQLDPPDTARLDGKRLGVGHVKRSAQLRAAFGGVHHMLCRGFRGGVLEAGVCSNTK